jgi:homoserine dehydrogenase
MREALRRRIPVVTSNKWPVALRGVELAAQARAEGVAFRAESTVMSGTPVLSALAEGLAGAQPVALRGLLNATANFILSRMADGRSYADALAEAQRAGLAERDPAADVEGHDAVAKVMILSGLVFGRQLRREQVAVRGITAITGQEIAQALSAGGRIKRRDARLRRSGRSRRRERQGAARVRPSRRPAGGRRRHRERRGVRGKPGRAGHHHRPGRWAGAVRAGSAERRHRCREPTGGKLLDLPG